MLLETVDADAEIWSFLVGALLRIVCGRPLTKQNMADASSSVVQLKCVLLGACAGVLWTLTSLVGVC